jgi:hypothetical protein
MSCKWPLFLVFKGKSFSQFSNQKYKIFLFPATRLEIFKSSALHPVLKSCFKTTSFWGFGKKADF